MPRTPKGDRAMSGAERQRRYWEKQKAILNAAKAGQAPEQPGQAGDTRELEKLRSKCEALEQKIAKLTREIDQEIPALKRKLSSNLTQREYQLIVRCLHPDNSASTERRAEAFQIFTKAFPKEDCRVERPTDLPRDVSSWTRKPRRKA